MFNTNQINHTALNRQLIQHAANDKQFIPNKIITSPPSGYVPQHDGVDNAPVFTLQKPIGIFVPQTIVSPLQIPAQKLNAAKNSFLGMFARKANQ